MNMSFIDILDRFMSDQLSMMMADESITRKAINAHGHLGSYYDACKDLLVGENVHPRSGQRIESSQPIRCILRQGNTNVSRNILQIIGVEDELRVSLLLGMTLQTGIVSILNESYRINEHSRVLYYSWIQRKEQISDDIWTNQQNKGLSQPPPTATHIITGITFGIDLLVVLHSSSKTKLNDIDPILEKITDSFASSTELFSSITSEEKSALSRDIQISIHSNIPALTGHHNLVKLLHQIDFLKKTPHLFSPISYSLHRFSSSHRSLVYHTLPSEMINDLEQYMLHKRAVKTTLQSIAYEDVRNLLAVYIEGRLYGANQQHLRMSMNEKKEMKRLGKLIIDFRTGHGDRSDIDRERLTLKHDNDELIRNLQDLKGKADLINQLFDRNFIYRNVVEYDVNRNDTEETIRKKLIKFDQSVRILCSNDDLNRNDSQNFNRFLAEMTHEYQQNPHLQLIYADFSYCSYPLKRMMVFSSNQSIHLASSSSKIPQTSVPLLRTSRSKTSSTLNDQTMNILLLGETGVGKSTFINALANYFTYDSLTQAKSHEPKVIIPASFLLTEGDDHQQRMINYGKIDSFNNENFNDTGQSVTEQCRSYIFNLKDNRGKLRIIDTPGFGDARGLEQDDRNMEHILQYLSRVPCLHAICFLLKPNSTRLNAFFRTCVNRLFSFLAPTIRQNVIFCFTNARSTLYAPGDTTPLLKTMLNDIPFDKENSFYFDSEAFRYLLARQSNISFTEEDERDYERSWTTSARESKRLIDYIQRTLRPFDIRRK